MTIQTLATLLVDAVLAALDTPTLTGIPASHIQAARTAVAQLIRDDSASWLLDEDEEGTIAWD